MSARAGGGALKASSLTVTLPQACSHARGAGSTGTRRL